MTNVQKSVSEYEGLLTVKERELLMQRNRVWAFLDTEHKSTTTKEYQAEVRKSGVELSDILFSLMELEKDSGFKDAAKVLCERCKSLDTYIRDMHQGLANDFSEKHKTEEAAKIDWVKNIGLIFALPFGFAASIKNGVTHGTVSPDTAFETGLVLGSVVVFRKEIKKAFESAKERLLIAPLYVTNSFPVYCFKETVKQNTLAGISGFREGAEALTREISTMPSRARGAIKQLTGKNKPKI